MPKKSKTTTTEILVAIFAVLFIFSLIGIIGVKQQATGSWMVKETPPMVQGQPPAPQGTPLQSSSQQITVTSGVQVTQTPVGPSGTTLSSGSSSFQVMMPK